MASARGSRRKRRSDRRACGSHQNEPAEQEAAAVKRGIGRGDDPVTPAVFAIPTQPKERPPEGGLQGMNSALPYARADTLLLRER
jgi:hypothetical protein